MTTATLTEFLLARITEDEAVARSKYRVTLPRGHEVLDLGDWVEVDGEGMRPAEYLDRFCEPTPDARVLARCEADRRIVELHADVDPDGVLYPESGAMCRTCHRDGDESDYPCPTLRALALPYAEHPDFDEAWRA